MEQFEIITKHGRVKLHHGGYLYVFERKNKGATMKFWRCEYFNSKFVKCKGRLHTKLDHEVIGQSGIHTCPSSAVNVEVQRVTSALKRRAMESTETPTQLRNSLLQSTPLSEPVLAKLPSENAVKRIVSRVRRSEIIKLTPPVPASLAALTIPPAYQVYKPQQDSDVEVEEEPFLLADSGIYLEDGRDNRILIFGRSSHVSWSADMHSLYTDGTFLFAPPPFEQVFVVFARRANWLMPIFYALLSSKSQSTYERMWALVREIWPQLQPQVIAVDLEQAPIGAILHHFPMCEIQSCLFHLLYTVKRRLAADALMLQRYREDPVFAHQTRLITSMAFLPIGDLTPAILALDSCMMEQLVPIMDWFIMTYTGRIRHNGTRTVPTFAPSIWSLYTRVLSNDRAVSLAETNHRMLQQAFGSTRQSIWRFIDTIRREQHQRDVDMDKCNAGNEPPPTVKRYRDADTRILRLLQAYQPSNLGDPNQIVPQQQFHAQPIVDFLSNVAHNYNIDT